MNRIPQIIHQIWSGIEDPLPEYFRKLGDTWKEDYPDWDYQFWDNDKMNHFVNEFYPQYVEFYVALPYDIQRWDVIRYLILYKMGGMYVDFDYQSLLPLNNLIEDKECCFAEEEVFYNEKEKPMSYFNNALMLSIPMHPFIEKVIHAIFSTNVGLLKLLPKDECVLNSTGPRMLSNLYCSLSHEEKESVYIIPAKYVTPFSVKQAEMVRHGYRGPEVEKCLEEAYAIHYFWGNWLNKRVDL